MPLAICKKKGAVDLGLFVRRGSRFIVFKRSLMYFLYLFSLVLMFIFHCLYVYVLDSQNMMCLLVMIVVNDEVIHY